MENFTQIIREQRKLVKYINNIAIYVENNQDGHCMKSMFVPGLSSGTRQSVLMTMLLALIGIPHKEHKEVLPLTTQHTLI